MDIELWYAFFGLSTVAGLLQLKQWKTDCSGPPSQSAFRSFQLKFLIAYVLAVFADWLQGPYVYALYKEYGFSAEDIGLLFVVGFGVSGILGIFIGSLADAMGRKFTCVLFCIVFSLSCITKHYNNFEVLMAGRLFGGIATSILYSSFDAWMVDEHHRRRFDGNWIGQTFARATFWNGLVAIVAGLVASYLGQNFGTVAPFDASLVCLVVCGVAILMLWDENYGTSPDVSCDEAGRLASMAEAIIDSLKVLHKNPALVYCGGIQSFFEGAMYSFVFVWTPALPEGLNLGLIFACFMVAVMIGSAISVELRTLPVPLPWILIGACTLGSLALLAASRITEVYARLLFFVSFEVIVGVYFPAYYTLRSQVVPDQGRATILNIFRIPLNVIVVSICLMFGVISVENIFEISSAILILATFCSIGVHMSDKPLATATPHLEISEDELGLSHVDECDAHVGSPGPSNNLRRD